MEKGRMIPWIMLVSFLFLSSGEAASPKMKIRWPSPMHRPMPPATIKIGNVVFKVKIANGESPILRSRLYRFVGVTCDAALVRRKYCTELNTIYLRDGQAINDERETLVHEIQHGILSTDKSLVKATYHQVIYELSPPLLAVFQNNPELRAYLTVPVPLGM